jgi:predicted nucleic acid-binding protein
LTLVVDASVALTWCFEDERTPATIAVLDRVVRDGAMAPSLWPFEVLNARATAQRRNPFGSERRLRLAGFLRQLPIAIDDDTIEYAWTTSAQLAERHRLAVHDAAYLELAQRMSLPLATLDGDLCSSARTLGVGLIGHSPGLRSRGECVTHSINRVENFWRHFRAAIHGRRPSSPR